MQAKREIMREKQAGTDLTESQESSLLTSQHDCIFHYRMNFKRHNLWKL
jgi:hypothetical protein